jgi:hypothetical protein
MIKALAITFLIVLYCCAQSDLPAITTPTAAQIAEFTNNAHITLPASAQAIGWKEERGLDDALWLQVRLPHRMYKRL